MVQVHGLAERKDRLEDALALRIRGAVVELDARSQSLVLVTTWQRPGLVSQLRPPVAQLRSTKNTQELIRFGHNIPLLLALSLSLSLSLSSKSSFGHSLSLILLD